MLKTITISDLRANLAKYIEDLEGSPLQVLQRSKPAAYLVSASDFERIIEQLEDLEDIVQNQPMRGDPHEHMRAMLQKMKNPLNTPNLYINDVEVRRHGE